ncbi:hypothetical protein LCGC14_0998630 [marine sediment metagenome]|uniref:Uncharacterized protein n=1 Tax=marine sediment metagenome TaxID=412755 RepID=A0A0F9NQ69_9ZZZZ
MSASIQCELCGFRFINITWAHLKYYHSGMTIEEYNSRFPLSSTKLSMNSKEAMVKGEETRRSMFSNMSPERRQEWVRRSFGNDESIKKRTESIRTFHRNMGEKERLEWVLQSFHNLTEEEGQAKNLAISKGVKKYWARLSVRERQEISRKFSEGHASMTQEAKDAWRKAQSEAHLAFWNGLSEKEKSARTRARMKAIKAGPSEPEVWLGVYLESRFPGEWLYNGDGSRDVVVGGKIPDFVHSSGDKKVLEVFGRYWHTEEQEVGLVEYYKQNGYSCIVVWEWDCYLWSELDKIFGGVT